MRPVILSALVGCGVPADPPPAVVDDPPVDTDDVPVVDTDLPPLEGLPAYEPLPPVALLVRASLDLRGVRPTLAELEAVEADPSVLDAMIDGFLDDPRFARRVAEIYDEVFLVRDEDPFVVLTWYQMRYPIGRLAAAIGEEPTRMLERIVAEGLSYREFVTGDWTMANELLADIWPVTYPEGATGWQVSQYTDGRPRAGVLVSNGLWWHHGSMINNLNRGRANQVSRTLLCFDYLAAEIEFGGIQALDSEAALGEAIRTNRSCAACHDTLDPLASHFFGFLWYEAEKRDPYDIRAYHPQREWLWSVLDGLPPAFAGQPTHGLEDLGHRIADQPAYSHCFAERSWEGLLRRDNEGPETGLVDRHDLAFRQADLDVRALYRHIVRSDAYRNGAGDHGRKLASPAVLSSAVADLTGFRWTKDDWDLVRAPMNGYGPLVGGVDGIFRTVRLEEPNTTLLLVQKRLAEAAAGYAVRQELGGAATPRLLTSVDGTEDPDDPAGEATIRAQIVELHARVLQQRLTVDDPRVTEELELFRTARALRGNPTEGWTTVVSLLLRDLDLVVY